MVHLAVSGDGRTAAHAVAVVLGKCITERAGRVDKAPAVGGGRRVARQVDLVLTPVHVGAEPVRLSARDRRHVAVDVQLEQELVAEIGLGTVERQVFVLLAAVAPVFVLALGQLHVRAVARRAHGRGLIPEFVFARVDHLGQFDLGVGIIVLPHVPLALVSVAGFGRPAAADGFLAAQSALRGKHGSSLVELRHDPFPVVLGVRVAGIERIVDTVQHVIHERGRAPQLRQAHHRPCTPGLGLGDHALALGGTVVEFVHDHVAFVHDLVETGIHLLVGVVLRIVDHGRHAVVFGTVVRARTARPALGRFGRGGCNVVYAPVAHHQVLGRDVYVRDQLLGRHIVRLRIGLVHLGDPEVLHFVETRLGARSRHHRSGKQTG